MVEVLYHSESNSPPGPYLDFIIIRYPSSLDEIELRLVFLGTSENLLLDVTAFFTKLANFSKEHSNLSRECFTKFVKILERSLGTNKVYKIHICTIWMLKGTCSRAVARTASSVS